MSLTLSSFLLLSLSISLSLSLCTYRITAVELNNGRAAMMGILGLMVHEKLGGALPIVGDM